MRRVLTILICTAYFISQAQPTGNRYHLVKLNEVNTRYNDGGPIVSADGNTLYFFVEDHPDNTLAGQTNGEHTQDIWVSKKDAAGVWSPPQHLPPPFNQNRLNQVFNVFDDGTILIRGTQKKNDIGFSLVDPSGTWTELKIKDFERMNKGQFWGASMSKDRKHMILYFSEENESLYSDLYNTHVQTDGSWSRPATMVHTTKLDDFGPFISPDQKTLYFATDSQRPGKLGLIDIYKSERLDDTWNNWGPPINLGRPLNTGVEDDYFSMNAAGDVFVARSASKSDGGNLDIFVLVRKDFKILLNGTVYDNRTKKGINGATVNARATDAPVSVKSATTGKYSARVPEGDVLVVDVSAEGFNTYSTKLTVPELNSDSTIIIDAYLNVASNTQTVSGIVYNKKTKAVIPGSTVQITARGFNPVNLTTDEAGKYSSSFPRPVVYSINVSASGFQPFSAKPYAIPKYKGDTTISVDVFLTPDAVPLVINGKVINKKTGAPVNAKVVITRRGTDSLNFTLAADSGVYSQEVPSTGMYYFTASQAGFLNAVDSLNYDNDEITPMTRDLVLQPIEVGTVVRLKNIYFDYGKASLKAESFVELEKVVTFLNENPTVEIEIQGHTDSDGPDAANLSLSQNRSQSVVNYIISQGISSNRLRAKGFGETKPIDNNKTPEGRANNRRVEFTVLKT